MGDGEAAMARRYRDVGRELNERQRRIWAAAEARSLGRGGIAAAARVCGLAENTVRRGIADLEAGDRLEPGRIRGRGAGRKRLEENDPTLLDDLDALLDPDSRGDPESPLRWTSKSARNLAEALAERGHTVSPRTVPRLLSKLEYSLQSNRKTKEGSSHPDREMSVSRPPPTAEVVIDVLVPGQ